jgi:hypothetical protein
MTEKQSTESIRTGVNAEKSRSNNSPVPKKKDRIYQIACTLPALRRKGVEQGDIPGIKPDGFDEIQLHDYLYKGSGAALSAGEFLLLEFLLKLHDPKAYPGFNLGRAVHVLDWLHVRQCLLAMTNLCEAIA